MTSTAAHHQWVMFWLHSWGAHVIHLYTVYSQWLPTSQLECCNTTLFYCLREFCFQLVVETNMRYKLSTRLEKGTQVKQYFYNFGNAVLQRIR